MAHKMRCHEFLCPFGVRLKKFTISTIFRKNPENAHTCNGKDAKHSNRHNFISVQDIDTVFACMVEFLGTANSNMLAKISRVARELPWQPNLGKNKPKLH